MILSLVTTFLLLIAGCFVGLQVYDLFKNEVARMLLIIAYVLFVVFMLFEWLTEYVLFV